MARGSINKIRRQNRFERTHAENTRTHKIGLVIWRLKCFYETLMQGSTLGILLNFCAINLSHRQAEER